MKAFLLALALLASSTAMAATRPATDDQALQRGKFLVGFGGCNDCHTPGWAEHGGQAPKDVLLTGGGMNFQGPWGTTYPPNLRLLVQQLTVEQWIATLRSSKARPAMPWWIFRDLDDHDLAAIYTYIHSLGPAGKPAHGFVPPGQTAPMPYFKLVLPPPPVRPAQH